MCERNEDKHGLVQDLVSLVFRHELYSTAVVQSVRKLDEYDSDIIIEGEKDPLEIFTDGDRIVLRKYSNSCVFCGEGEDIIEFNGKHICPKCLKGVKGL